MHQFVSQQTCDASVTQSVLFHSSRSPTLFGLPEGSGLGPQLHIQFTADIGLLLASCSLASHDVQAYKHRLASQAHSASRIVSHVSESSEITIHLVWYPPTTR